MASKKKHPVKDCVYRYTDLSDGIIKYVGITNRKRLDDRMRDHRYTDNWRDNGAWKIEYFVCDNQAEAEAFEAHLISLYGTNKYYNKVKATWGINKWLPNVEGWWKVHSVSNFANVETMLAARYVRQLIRDGNISLAKELLFNCFEFEINEE